MGLSLGPRPWVQPGSESVDEPMDRSFVLHVGLATSSAIPQFRRSILGHHDASPCFVSHFGLRPTGRARHSKYGAGLGAACAVCPPFGGDVPHGHHASTEEG